MTDTPRTQSYLTTAFADNTVGNITAQNARDLIVSTVPTTQPSYSAQTPTWNTDGTFAGWIGPQYALQRWGGWSVIGSRTGRSRTQNSANTSYSTRVEIVPPCSVQRVKLIYSSNIVLPSSGGAYDSPATNLMYVKSSIEDTNYSLSLNGSSVQQASSGKKRVSYEGKTIGVLFPNCLLRSDEIDAYLSSGTRSYITTYITLPNYGTPSAPSVAASAGTGFPAGTYAVGVTLVYSNNEESACSAYTTVTTSGSNFQITVTAPSSVSGAIGYKVWISSIGATTIGYDSYLGVIPFTTNAVASKPATSSAFSSTEKRWFGGNLFVSTGPSSAAGGTGAGASNNGEFSASSVDMASDGSTAIYTTSGSSSMTPNIILGWTPDRIRRSFAIIGDSISVGTGDSGYSNTGSLSGYMCRCCHNQASQRYISNTIAPLFGVVQLGAGGEAALHFATSQGDHRRQLAKFCTDFFYEYGINDIGTTGVYPVPTGVNDLVTINNLTQSGMTCWLLTLVPHTKSTDGWTTLANQSWPDTSVPITKEPGRRQLNNWRRSTASTGQSINNENMMGCYATVAYNGSFTNGGDATATLFLTSLPFATGTETIKVNGVTKAITTDYTYLGQTTINSTAYASGVQFVSAPASSVTVTATYTSAPGFKNMCAVPSLVNIVDVASAIEVNSSGTLTTNGGLFPAANNASMATGTSSGSNSASTLNNTTQSWTQDQYRNYCVYIVSDSTTPAAAGQCSVISSNTSTQLAVVWTTTPSSTATYKIYDPYCFQAPHPSPYGHMTIAAYLQTQIPASA